MPVLWRYLTAKFLKVFTFSVLAFIAVLLTLRLEEIAHFASIDTSGEFIIWFVLYQIPYILPVAIPLSCLISAMLLMLELSDHHEILALRSLGFSIRKIFAPILLSCAFISLTNFILLSEVSTFSHLQTSLLKTELRSVNPLLLLHNKHLIKMKGIFYDTWGYSKMGEEAHDVILAMPNKPNERMNLMIAKKLFSEKESFIGEGISFITSFRNKEAQAFDPIAIENTKKMESKINDFASLIQKKVWKIHEEHFGFKDLLIKINELSLSNMDAKQKKKDLSKLYSEIARRTSLGCAPFIFALLGLSFGLEIGRRKKKLRLVFVTLLTAFYMVTFFIGKGISDHPEATLILYLLPPLIIVIASFWQIKRIQMGID